MRWTDILSYGLSSLFRRRLRSILTMLGVTIGTAAIIVTVSLGYGAQEAQMSALESATNLQLIQVYPYYAYSSSASDGSTPRLTRIDDAVLRDIRALDGVAAATPVVNVYLGASFTLAAGKYKTAAQLVAVSPVDFSRIWKLKGGRYFSGGAGKLEFIMSEVAMSEFRDPDASYEYVDVYTYLNEGKDIPLPNVNWYNQTFDLTMQWEDYENADSEGNPSIYEKDYDAKLVGVLESSVNDWTFAYSTIVSLDTLRRLYRDNKQYFDDQGFTGLEKYDNVYVLADSVDTVESVTKALHDYGLQYYSPLDIVATVREQVRSMQGFLGFIGAVSMLVAALSIANTMMMSIYERTREIGVMKVLGCKLTTIRALFLTEAAYIGVFGGGLGVLVSLGVSYALNHVTWLQNLVSGIMNSTVLFTTGEGSTSLIPPALAWGTWLFVVLVSILSGLSPARRAMRLSSLAAIRNADA